MNPRPKHLSPIRLIRNQDGMAFIELAMVLPVLMVLLLGAIDMSRLISARMDMEQAAQRVTDYALSVRPTNGDTSYLVTEAIAASGLAAENVTAQIFLVCNGVRSNNFNGGCASGEASARYVSISIRDDVDPFFDWTALAGMVGLDAFNSSFSVVGDSTVRIQ